MIALQILVGILYANLLEYVVHRFLFHGLGRSGSSIFAFHLRSHHLVSRRDGFYDTRISRNEMLGMPVLALFHLPLLIAFPAFYYTIVAYAFFFIVVHNALHHYPHFAKRYFWWHWNHHMRNQNKSWGVVLPITDILTGTLEDNRVKEKISTHRDEPRKR